MRCKQNMIPYTEVFINQVIHKNVQVSLIYAYCSFTAIFVVCVSIWIVYISCKCLMFHFNLSVSGAARSHLAAVVRYQSTEQATETKVSVVFMIG